MNQPQIIPNYPDTQYHASSHIGSTTAVLGVDNPLLLAEALAGRYRVEDKPCFVAGRLMHMAALEPERFNEMTTSEGPINPRTGAAYGRQTKMFTSWQAENPDVHYIDPWIRDALNTMPDEVARIIATSETELSHFCTIDGVDAKCRTDIIDTKKEIFYDLKTISTNGNTMERAIEKAIINRKYWFTTAWYERVLQECYGTHYGRGLIFVEKEMPHRWRIVELDFDYLQLGLGEVVRVMKMIRNNNLMEDKDDLFYMASCPNYLMDEEEEEEI